MSLAVPQVKMAPKGIAGADVNEIWHTEMPDKESALSLRAKLGRP
jgi:hypothetical protein